MDKLVKILSRTSDGREALLEMIETYGGFTTRFSADPIEQARIVAVRKVATDIIQKMLTDELNSFTVMMQERFARSQVQRAEKENDDDSGN